MIEDKNRTYLPDTDIEIITPDLEGGPFSQAIFDFDGTISVIREGWQQVMVSMMVEILQATPQAEDEAALHRLVTGFITRLTGQQTIYQMEQLVTEVEQRGGQPKTAQAYKGDYLELLAARVDGRVAGIEAGRIEPAEMVVPGAIEILKTLRQQGLTCYLASGTDEKSVIEEARVLGVAQYFDGGIYGARDDGRAVSKKMLIRRVLTGQGLPAPQLVVFGDGNDEIEQAAAAGCIAVGVASNEAERQGINEFKRRQLIQAGADLIIPDFRQREPLLRYLRGA